jgi:PAS domain S-box-containing protein
MLPSSLSEQKLFPEKLLDCIGAITNCLYEGNNLDEIFKITTQTIRTLLKVDRVLISYFQPDKTNNIVVESVDSNWISLLEKTVADLSLKNNFNQIYTQENKRKTANNYPELLHSLQAQASFDVPIFPSNIKSKHKSKNCQWGLLIIHQCSYSRQWQPLEVKLLQQVAIQLGIAIHHQANSNGPKLGQTSSQLSDNPLEITDIFLNDIHTCGIERALHESEQLFRQIFQNAPIAISLVDYYTHKFIQVNPAHYHLLGYTKLELASLTFEDISHPDDLLQNLAYLEQFKFGIFDSFRMEKRFVKKNGELIKTNITVSILADQDYRPKFSLAMIEDITERRQAEDKIKASLLEKETLLKEVHHRVKNNLQIISSLLRLQSRQITDHKAIAVFKESQNRVQAMALIHEKLYQSSSLAKIDFQEYITTLVQELFCSYQAHKRGINFKIQVNQISLAINLATPFGLIINELVSNSLKYAFLETVGGQIFISLQEHIKGQFILIISDNGRGIPQNLDFRNTNSLGLQLVCRLTKQVNGTIELDQSQGTLFKIIFATQSSEGSN